jgi:trimeric autotransporter adhesin
MRKLIPLMMSLALVVGCGDDNDPTGPAGTISVSTTQANATVVAGSTTSIPIAITRTGSFSGAVNLTAENLPTGVTATFSPASVASGSTVSLLTLTAASSATAQAAAPITIRASGTGVTSATTTIPVTVAVNGVSVVLGTTSATLTQGATISVPVTLTRLGTFADAVTLAVDGLPAGVTATITPASIAAGSTTATVILTANSTAALGTHNVFIRGAGTAANVAQAIAVTVVASTTSGLSFTAAPAAFSVVAGQTAQTTITVTRTGGFTGDVTFTLENAPTGMTATVEPATVTGGTAVVTISTTAATPVGTHQVRLRGTSGTTNNTVALTVIVTAAP